MRCARPEYRSQAIPAFLRRAAEVGAATPGILNEFRLPRDTLARREVLLPIDLAQAVPDAIAAELGDPLLGAHVAGSLPRGAYGAVEFALRSAPTVRDFCECIVRHGRLLDALTICTFELRHGEALLSMRIPGEPRCFGRHGNELVLAFVSRLLCEALPEGWAPRRAWLAHEEPKESAALATLLRTESIAFEVGSIGLAFDEADLALPLAGSDAALLAVLDEHVELLLAGRPAADELRARVEEVVCRVLPRGTPRLAEIAPALAMSERTLQRRLEESGTGFGDLVEELRRDRALLYLGDRRRSVAEIAYQLGYGEPANFNRAFRRWTGMTPSRYRARARA